VVIHNGATLRITESLTLTTARGIEVQGGGRIEVVSGRSVSYSGVIRGIDSASGQMSLGEAITPEQSAPPPTERHVAAHTRRPTTKQPDTGDDSLPFFERFAFVGSSDDPITPHAERTNNGLGATQCGHANGRGAAVCCAVNLGKLRIRWVVEHGEGKRQLGQRFQLAAKLAPTGRHVGQPPAQRVRHIGNVRYFVEICWRRARVETV
jgi:hypothetical protein